MPKTIAKFDHAWYFVLPKSWFIRLQEIWRGKHDSMAAGLRYLIKKEILTHGPLPKPTASAPKPSPAERREPRLSSDVPEPPITE